MGNTPRPNRLGGWPFGVAPHRRPRQAGFALCRRSRAKREIRSRHVYVVVIGDSAYGKAARTPSRHALAATGLRRAFGSFAVTSVARPIGRALAAGARTKPGRLGVSIRIAVLRAIRARQVAGCSTPEAFVHGLSVALVGASVAPCSSARTSRRSKRRERSFGATAPLPEGEPRTSGRRTATTRPRHSRSGRWRLASHGRAGSRNSVPEAALPSPARRNLAATELRPRPTSGRGAPACLSLRSAR